MEAPRWRWWLSAGQDAVLVVATGLFLWVHLHAALGGSLKNVPFVAEQFVLVVLFLTRRRAARTSTRPKDWVVAAVGAWLPLAFQIEGEQSGWLASTGTFVQSLGVSLAAASIFYLGRSFGIVAADRGLKTGGPYRVVRHPIYAAHLLTSVGFLLANPSPLNGALFLSVLTAQVLRIEAEERFLAERADYSTYRERVPWRLLPFVY